MTDRTLWDLYAIDTPRTDAITDRAPALHAAAQRITWAHYQRLLDAGIPSRALAALSWGIVTIQGREMIVTDDPRLRAYLTGPVLAGMP